MTSEDYVALLREDVFAWNQFRKANPTLKPDFTLSILRRQHLAGVDLHEAKLRVADFCAASLSGANLQGADLTDANLASANLSNAMMVGANLSGADLRDAHFNGAHLAGANFDKAIAGYTTFANVDLSVANKIETAIHAGPSTIGIDTIYRSKGRIPEVFLRGAGVPENFITFMHSLAGTAFEFYSCFISHSSKDHEFATRLHADLQVKESVAGLPRRI